MDEDDKPDLDELMRIYYSDLLMLDSDEDTRCADDRQPSAQTASREPGNDSVESDGSLVASFVIEGGLALLVLWLMGVI